MKEITAEWVAKAEEDYFTAQTMLAATERSAFNAVCFHTQQCIEKYAKAFLSEHEVVFKPTHSMLYLNQACAAIDSEFAKQQANFEILNDYAVDMRYPGANATKRDAEDAVDSMNLARSFIRQKLNLPTD